MKRVVITGMGIWSCLGTDIEEVKESLAAGKSGIGLEEKRLEYGYQSALTGIVPKPELKGLIDRHLRRGLSEEAEYAFMASRQAFKMAGIDDKYLEDNDYLDLKKLAAAVMEDAQDSPSTQHSLSMAAYYLGCFADLIKGTYFYNSFFYDTHRNTSRLNKQVFEEIQANPQLWALVIFDCHY